MSEYILLLFYRPREPIFMPKGDKKIFFGVPPEYLTEKYRPFAAKILTHFENEAALTIPIKRITIPDISQVLEFGRDEDFSILVPKHDGYIGILMEIFLSMPTAEDLLSLAAYCRDRVNTALYVYSLLSTLIYHPATRNINLPRLHEIFPSLFFENKIFSKAREEATILPTGLRIPIELSPQYAGSSDNVEERLAYFCQDLGVGNFHIYWHFTYPYNGELHTVDKDRRGELFIYTHHQLLTRYAMERLCNGLGRIKPIENLREAIPEGYFPKLDRSVSGQTFPGRPANMKLADVDLKKYQYHVTISEMELWRSRIIEAIRCRKVRNTKGEIIHLDEKDGINILGNLVESSTLSPDYSFYGDYHNNYPSLISFIHDPNMLHNESSSVISNAITSFRDPVFFRWHQHIDNIFYQFLDSLPPYTNQELQFPGIVITNVNIKSQNSNSNTLSTHWTKTDINITNGLEFFPRNAILVRLQHLNYDTYTYNITINNNHNYAVKGTVRIFIAPKYDENGHVLPFNEQRKLMVDMDKFTTTLYSGQNEIVRKSTDSAMTIPYQDTFQSSSETFHKPSKLYVGMGWPQNLLVPRGTKQGFPMDLFVMISNDELDLGGETQSEISNAGISLFGLRDHKYPDKRAMGFPFDRPASQKVRSLSDFLTSNMKQQQITVRFTDVVKPHTQS